MKEWHPDLALDKFQSTRWIRMFLKGRWISVVLKKRSVCHCRTLGFHLWVGKIPWSREWQPTPVSLPGKFHGQKSLAGYSPWGCKESNTTECVHTHTELPVKWTKSTNLEKTSVRMGTWFFNIFLEILLIPHTLQHLGLYVKFIDLCLWFRWTSAWFSSSLMKAHLFYWYSFIKICVSNVYGEPNVCGHLGQSNYLLENVHLKFPRTSRTINVSPYLLFTSPFRGLKSTPVVMMNHYRKLTH